MRNTFIIALMLVCISACAYKPTHYLPVEHNTPPQGALYGRFLGTSNLYFSDGHDAIMIDAYMTRKGLVSVFWNNFRSSSKQVDAAFKQADITQVDEVLIAHAHFDHVLDVPALAVKFPEVIVHGSPRTKAVLADVSAVEAKNGNVERAQKMQEALKRFTLLRDQEPFSVGDFTVTAIASPHADKTDTQKKFEAFLIKHTDGKKYEDPGQNYSFHLAHPQANILVIPSAGYPETFNGLQADVVFMGIGLLSNELKGPGRYPGMFADDYIAQYWHKAVTTTCAKKVVPIHWDFPFTTLQEAPRATYSMVDDIEQTVARLTQIAQRTPGCNGEPVEIVFPRGYSRFKLTTPVHSSTQAPAH